MTSKDKKSPITVFPIKVSFTFMKNYCYLVMDKHTKDAILIDPAFEKKNISSTIESSNAKVQAILITHGHKDHIHLAHYFSKLYHCPIVIR